MKKHKSVISILLAVMMIFTFMPTLAFAGTTTASTAGHVWGDNNTGIVTADFEGLKVLEAPTCTRDGVGEITCTVDLNGEACGAVKTVWIASTGHKLGNRVRVKAGDLIDYLYKDYYSASEIAAIKAAWYEANPDGKCEAYVYKCDNCDRYLLADGSELDALTEIPDGDWTAHTEPSGTAKCAETFTCSVCGVAERTNLDAVAHTPKTSTKYAHVVGSLGSDGLPTEGSKYVEITTTKCSVCGKESSTTDASSYGGTAISHGTTAKRVVPSDIPCKNPGREETYCTDCGMVTQFTTDWLADHTYVAYGPYTKGDDDDLLYMCEKCVVCGDVKPNSEYIYGFAPEGSEYKANYSTVASANCEQGSWVKVTVTYGGKTVGYYFLDDEDIEDLIKAGAIVKIGDKYYDRHEKAEVPYTKALEHKFGDLTKVADATCLERGIEAKVCEKCGKVDHNTVARTDKALGHEVTEVTVDATCGEAGYTYKTCTRCSQYLDKNGKTAAENGADKPYAEPQKYNETKPVVALGTKCTYEWKTLEEATAFSMGTRAKVCTVCEHMEEATKESIAKKTIAAPKVKALKKKAKVTVKAVEGATKYQILVNGKVSKTVKKAGTFTVKKGIKAGKKNKFQIRAINADGVKATSKAKSVKIKKK